MQRGRIELKDIFGEDVFYKILKEYKGDLIKALNDEKCKLYGVLDDTDLKTYDVESINKLQIEAFNPEHEDKYIYLDTKEIYNILILEYNKYAKELIIFKNYIKGENLLLNSDEIDLVRACLLHYYDHFISYYDVENIFIHHDDVFKKGDEDYSKQFANILKARRDEDIKLRAEIAALKAENAKLRAENAELKAKTSE